jgi:hypothetical protein
MVDRFYGGTASSRNCDHAPHRPSIHTKTSHPGIAEHPDVTPGLLAPILAIIDEQGGVATIGDIADALPDHPWPISAVLALVDKGPLVLDIQAPFDADMRIRLITART